MGADKNIAQAHVLVASDMAVVVQASVIYTPATSGSATLTIAGVPFVADFATSATQTVTNITALINAAPATLALVTPSGTTTLTLTAVAIGTAGNGIAVSETGSGSLNHTTVQGGTGLTSGLTSRAMRSAILDDMSFQATWSGTSPVGTLDVQVSNDHQENGGVVTNAGNWTSIYTAPQAVTGNTGTLFLNIAAISAAWIRCVYAPTSGTGTLDVYFNGRSI
jgi:hypothetical protein